MAFWGMTNLLGRYASFVPTRALSWSPAKYRGRELRADHRSFLEINENG
jgi:hypothetical protein